MVLVASQAAICFASATVSPTSLNWNFVPVGGRGGQKTLTLTNTQTGAIIISSLAIAGANPGDFQIYSKTCGASLAASASCTANVVFTPTTTGNRSATLQFTDSATNTPQSVPLTGLGVAANSLSPNPSSLSFASTAIGVSTAAQTVLMTNATSASVTFSKVALSGTNAGDFSVSTTSCTSTLVAGGSCSTSIVFKPTASGTRTATLQFTDSAGNSPQAVALSGTGAGSTSISAAPSTLTFASTTIGSTSASQSATLSNSSASTITITSVAISGTNASDFSIASNSCTSTLVAASSCIAAIVFKPTASGTRAATLQFTDSAGNSPQSVTLSGTGATASGGTATVSPSNLSWNFVPVGGVGGKKSVTLANSGTAAITISGIVLTGANPGDFKISSNTCGSGLAASASCTASIAFAPTTTGNRSATLQFTDSATNSPQAVPFTGLGVAANSLSPNPSSLSFASTAIGSSTAAQTVLMTNATSASVTFSKVAISGTNAGDFSVSATSCTSTLVAGGSCSTSIVFKPTASGTRAATLQFTDTAVNSPQSVALSGTGAGSTSISATPSTLTFASTTIGSSSASQSATLSNTTASTITITSVAISGTNAGDFSIASNSCASSLAAGIQCTTSVLFKPTASGTRTATLQFTDSAGNSPQSVALTGTGAASTSISATPSTLTFASTTIGSSSASQSATLSNTSASTITITSVTISGTNPGDFSIASNSCTSNLAPAGQCIAAIVFKPTASGTRTATLQFTDSAGNSPQSVALTGTGASTSSATASPSSLSWAFVPVGGVGGKKSITLTNNSTSSITISSVALTGANPGDFKIASNTCASSVAASASCNASISFAPTTTGDRSATLQFTDSAGNSPQTAALTGLGVAPNSVTPNPPSLTFATTGIGSSSSSQSVVLTNATTSAITISSVVVVGADEAEFSIASTSCGSTLAAGGNCSTAIVFRPAAEGTRSATLQFSDSATNNPQTVSLTGTGTSSALTITPSFVNLHALNTQTFTANLPVTWSATCGSITSAGVYTAPADNVTCGITAETSSGTPYAATAAADVDISNYTARKSGGGQLGLASDELALTPSNVNANTFGLQWTTAVDAWVNAQPLYMNALSVNGAPHNVVFVVTANDSVYALDGDTGAQLWHVSLIPAGATAVTGSTVGFTSAPLIGILGTPVIDPTTNTMYVVAETSEQNATYFPHRLHALDITTGAEKFGGPVLINDPQMAPMHKLQRPGLTLANGNIYVAIGSMEDIQPYHGYLFAFNAATLAQEAVWNVTPTGSEGGIWMGASAPSVDEDGNIYVTTGNGTFDGTSNFGEAAVKLSPSLQVLDYFAPYNFNTYDASDVDLGSGSAMVVPYQNGSHPNEIIVCGKPTPVYVLDRDNLGQIGTTSDNVIQRLDNEVGAPRPGTTSVQACFTGPAMWGQNVYFGGKYDVLKMFTLDSNTGLLSSTPVSQGTRAYGYPGADPVISSNGPANGIVWTIDTASSALIAVDATDLTKTLFSGPLSGGAIRWTAPTPVNGHVYVGEEGVVYGFGLK